VSFVPAAESPRLCGLIAAGVLLLLVFGCHAPCPAPPAAADPLAWPGVGLSGLGDAAEDSGVPLVRESGALLSRVGGLLQAPAHVVEGLVAGRPAAGPRMVVQGVGETATAAINLPFCWMIGGGGPQRRGRAADVRTGVRPVARVVRGPSGARSVTSAKSLDVDSRRRPPP